MTGQTTLKARQKFGGYRIEARVADGPLAAVYSAFDTILGIRVALKMPHPSLMDDEYFLQDFRKEVRLVARMDHPHILPVRHAGYIEGRFVIVTPLGDETLAERMTRRLSLQTALDYSTQALEAVAYAHARKIIHCDIKPENFILFPGDCLKLGDFGFAKIGSRTLKASGSGTVGYVAPEQALGRPMFQSDVFSLGLVLYRMFSGRLPEWPYRWPPRGAERLRRKLSDSFIEFLRKAIAMEPRERYRHGGRMLAAYRRVRPHAIRRRRRRKRPPENPERAAHHWQAVRHRQFQKRFRQALDTHFACRRCGGPVAESMLACPWCGRDKPVPPGETRFPALCPSCGRGVKLDWHYCAWCYGRGFEVETRRQYSDRRYTARCSNSSCSRRQLMPFMRYCPWCRTKVRRRWPVPGSKASCPHCGHGFIKGFWNYCPWCRHSVEETRR